MRSNELIDGGSALFEVCDHTALRCSGTGAREGESFNDNALGDFGHGALIVTRGGLIGAMEGCKHSMKVSNH